MIIRVSQISKIFGPTVFCVLLNERKLVRPSLGILRVIFHVGQASKAHWSGGTFWLQAYWALKAWPTWKMTLNMPKLGLTSFLSLSRTQKTVVPKILEIWDTLLASRPAQIIFATIPQPWGQKMSAYHFLSNSDHVLPRLWSPEGPWSG